MAELLIASLLKLLFNQVLAAAITVITATAGPFFALLVFGFLSVLLVFLLVTAACRFLLFMLVTSDDFLSGSFVCCRDNLRQHRCIVRHHDSVRIVCKELVHVIKRVLVFDLLLRLPDPFRLFLFRFPGALGLLLLILLLLLLLLFVCSLAGRLLLGLFVALLARGLVFALRAVRLVLLLLTLLLLLFLPLLLFERLLLVFLALVRHGILASEGQVLKLGFLQGFRLGFVLLGDHKVLAFFAVLLVGNFVQDLLLDDLSLLARNPLLHLHERLVLALVLDVEKLLYHGFFNLRPAELFRDDFCGDVGDNQGDENLKRNHNMFNHDRKHKDVRASPERGILLLQVLGQHRLFLGIEIV